MDERKERPPADGLGEVAQLGVLPGQVVTQTNAPAGEGSDLLDRMAPVIRRGLGLREAVYQFRHERVRVPATLPEAFEALALSLELYETAREIEREAHETHAAHMDAEPETRERAIGYLLDADEKAKVTAETRATALGITGDRSASSRTAAEKLVDLVPFVVAFNAEARRLHRLKLDAEKETSVARRRHDTCKLFAERIPLDVARLVSFTGDVRVHRPDSMSAAEIFEIVQREGRDRAQRRGGWREYPPTERRTSAPAETRDGEVTTVLRDATNAPAETLPPLDVDAVRGELPTLRNGESLIIDGGTVTP